MNYDLRFAGQPALLAVGYRRFSLVNCHGARLSQPQQGRSLGQHPSIPDIVRATILLRLGQPRSETMS